MTGDVPALSRQKITQKQRNVMLADLIAKYRYDFHGLIMDAFPWGEGRLAKQTGPDTWQKDVLDDLSADLKRAEQEGGPVRIAVASGHGIGKTALIAWIIHAYMLTRPNCFVTVTANTERQLMSKTWRELAKWHNMSAFAELLVLEKTKYTHKDEPMTWICNATPWSETNSESFAGQHEKYSMVLMDEASSIADEIWNVVAGSLTTDGATHIAFGNPTRNEGWFYNVFHKLSHRWNTRSIDSRTAKMANKAYFQELVDDYGIEDDFVRVRVLGKFPRSSSNQFFAQKDIEAAVVRSVPDEELALHPVVMGVDIARFGENATVICWRQGPKLLRFEKYPDTDMVEASKHILRAQSAIPAQTIFIDESGIGGSVVDILSHAGVDNVTPVNAAWTSSNPSLYTNKRHDLFRSMRKWMLSADIPDNADFLEDLRIITEVMSRKTRKVAILSKPEMKRLFKRSPDFADAVSMTFLEDVPLIEDKYDIDDMLTDMTDNDMGADRICGY